MKHRTFNSVDRIRLQSVRESNAIKENNSDRFMKMVIMVQTNGLQHHEKKFGKN